MHASKLLVGLATLSATATAAAAAAAGIYARQPEPYPDVMRLAACFHDDGTYYLQFAMYSSYHELNGPPRRKILGDRTGDRPLWEGGRVNGVGQNYFFSDITVDAPGETNSEAGTADDNFMHYECYSDGQHVVYQDEGRDCQSIYYCTAWGAGPLGGG